VKIVAVKIANIRGCTPVNYFNFWPKIAEVFMAGPPNIRNGSTPSVGRRGTMALSVPFRVTPPKIALHF